MMALDVGRWSCLSTSRSLLSILENKLHFNKNKVSLGNNTPTTLRHIGAFKSKMIQTRNELGYDSEKTKQKIKRGISRA